MELRAGSLIQKTVIGSPIVHFGLGHHRRGRHRDRDLVQQPERPCEHRLPQREAEHRPPGHGRQGLGILQRPDRGVAQRAAEFVADRRAGSGALEGECVRVACRQVFAKRAPPASFGQSAGRGR